MKVNYPKMPEVKFDFGGFATKYGVECADGRIIKTGAFQHQDNTKVPMVWHHLRKDPGNILGHAWLEHRDDGVYAYGVFNNSENGRKTKLLVQSEDIDSLSIFANNLVQQQSLVHSGVIRELSLVVSGANPGAKIDNLTLEHADGTEDTLEDEAIIFGGLEIIVHEDEKEDLMPPENNELTHADDERTVKDVLDSMTDEQKDVTYALIGQALEEGDVEHDAFEGEDFMKHNVFNREGTVGPEQSNLKTLNGVFNDILHLAQTRNMKLSDAVLVHASETLNLDSELVHDALEHDSVSITNVGYLFPDARPVRKTPDIVRLDQTWVKIWLNETNHLPFSRVKSMYTDISVEEARARGWITDSETAKADMVLSILKRTTEPQTVYVRSDLYRDDIIDITDFYVVAWMKAIQREKLDEEIARAALISDGRGAAHADKIDEAKIRPILGDSSVYVEYVTMEAAVTDSLDIIEAIISARRNYKGTGRPTLFIEPGVLTDMLLVKDTTDRYIFNTEAELAAKLRVSRIVEVDLMTGVQREDAEPFTADLFGIMVNPSDYSYGADKGGQLGMFDDFDIDFNKYKYLMETRASGALTRPKSAMVIERKTA
jgi:hypothetical protein